jgi:hypothetical protein
MWAKIELSVAAGVVVTDITSLAGETNPAALPASFTGAYDGTKGGHYITPTKRCVGLVWINAAGAVAGIVNAIGGCDGYSGYATSNNANLVIYPFLKLDYVYAAYATPRRQWKTANYTIYNPPNDIIINITGGRTLTLPDATLNTGIACTIIKSDDNQWWVKIIAVAGTITSKTGAAATTTWIRRYLDSVTFVSDGTNWYAVTDTRMIYIDSGSIACATYQAKKRGTCNLIHAGGAMTEATIKGMKLVGNTTGSYGWITAYDSGTKMIYLRDVVSTSTAKVFSNGETLNIVDVDAGAVTSTTLSAADWKGTETYAYHGFNTSDQAMIDIELYYSLDNTTWFKVAAPLEDGSTHSGYGVINNSVNQLQLSIASYGAQYINAAGNTAYLTTTDSFYRIVMVRR